MATEKIHAASQAVRNARPAVVSVLLVAAVVTALVTYIKIGRHPQAVRSEKFLEPCSRYRVHPI